MPQREERAIEAQPNPFTDACQAHDLIGKRVSASQLEIS